MSDKFEVLGKIFFGIVVLYVVAIGSYNLYFVHYKIKPAVVQNSVNTAQLGKAYNDFRAYAKPAADRWHERFGKKK